MERAVPEKKRIRESFAEKKRIRESSEADNLEVPSKYL